jgi:heptosyltransferase-3
VPGGSGWLQSTSLIRHLWRRYDLALVAQYTDRAHLYGWIAARVRSGQVPADRQAWWKRALLDHMVVLHGDHSHAVIDKLSLLSPWAEPDMAEVVAPSAEALPAALAGRLRPPYVVVHAPSLVRYKQWPLAHYAELAKALAGDGLQVLLSGGPSDADRAAVAEVARMAAMPDVVPIAGMLSLNQLTTLLRGASLYVGPDTSVTHLAAACDIPVVALYGSIDPQHWGPWAGRLPPRMPYERRALVQRSGKVILLQGTPACVPCNRAGCEDHNASRSECLETMDPQRVGIAMCMSGSRSGAPPAMPRWSRTPCGAPRAWRSSASSTTPRRSAGASHSAVGSCWAAASCCPACCATGCR